MSDESKIIDIGVPQSLHLSGEELRDAILNGTIISQAPIYFDNPAESGTKPFKKWAIIAAAIIGGYLIFRKK
ncbi:MAG: hypothetical protein WC959_07535 [Kiritimatiellales bacterium]